MLFNSEEDKQLAMQCVANAPVSGPAQEVAKACNRLAQLLADMENAEIFATPKPELVEPDDPEPDEDDS